MTKDCSYRLFLSEAEWRQLPEKLNDPYFAEIARTNRLAIDAIVATAGDYLELPAMLNSDDEVKRQFDQWRAGKVRIQRDAVAWFLERRDDDLKRLLMGVDYFLEHATWELIYEAARIQHADLGSGDIWYIISFCLDALGPELGRDRIARLVAMAKEGLQHYLDGIRNGDWWRRCDFNWGAAVHGNAGLCALAIEPFEPKLAATVLHEAERGIEFVVAAFPSGGGWIEGLMYQTTTIAHLTDFVAAHQRVKGSDFGIARNQNFVDALTYRMYMLGGDGVVLNFSNCNEQTREWAMAHVYWWSKRLDRSDLTAFEDAHVKDWRYAYGLFHDVEAFWYRDAFQPSEAVELQRLKHFREIDWLTWHGEHSWLAFRSGFSGGNHCNSDLGQFIFGIDGDRFLVDPGYGAGKPEQHNIPATRGMAPCATAKIFRVQERDNGFYLACDLSDDNPEMLHYHYRHVLLVDDRHLLVVDDIMARRGRRNGARFHMQTHLPVELNDDGFRIEGRQHTLQASLLKPVAQLRRADWEWRSLPVTTVSWCDAHDRVHSLQPVLFSPDAKTVSCEVADDILTLHIDGNTYRIELMEGILL